MYENRMLDLEQILNWQKRDSKKMKRDEMELVCSNYLEILSIDFSLANFL